METNSSSADQVNTRKPKLRWYQFSLRTLLIVTTLVACACGWFARRVDLARNQHVAVEAIKKTGAIVQFTDRNDSKKTTVTLGSNFLPKLSNDCPTPPGPKWLQKWLPLEFIMSPRLVSFTDAKVNDSDLVYLKELRELEALDLRDDRISDAGLEFTSGMTQLRYLNLSHNLRVTDAGLIHLKGMNQLEELNLSRTRVTETGLLYLKGMTRLKKLNLGNSQLNDAGLANLTSLSQLEEVVVLNTQVTSAGIAKFKADLPKCFISPGH